MIEEITIIAAHFEDTEQGDLLQLWVRQPREDIEFELKFDDGDDEEDFF